MLCRGIHLSGRHQIETEVVTVVSLNIYIYTHKIYTPDDLPFIYIYPSHIFVEDELVPNSE
jgi:hypothetical protein